MLVRYKLFHRNSLHIADTRAFVTCAEWVVEGEHSGLKLGEGNSVLLAGILL